jgi:molecular chaperone GrpE
MTGGDKKNNSEIDPMTPPQDRDGGVEIPVTIAGKPAHDIPAPPDFQAERDDAVGHLQRLQAEFSNYRKRVEKERESLSAWVKGDLIIALLPVLDDAELLIQPAKADPSSVLEAARMIVRKFKKTLEDEGLEEIAVKKGESFNPEIHHAIGVEETGPENDGRIMEQWRKGYRFKNRLLRPSHVKVGKARDRKDGTETS